jgi:hypothetical protein
MADGGQCAKYLGGELEHPACHLLKDQHVTFNDTEPMCQCATDTSSPLLRAHTTGDKLKQESTHAAKSGIMITTRARKHNQQQIWF